MTDQPKTPLISSATERPGTQVLLLLAAISYASLRFAFNVEYIAATWEQLVNFTAQAPFGHRLLIPALANMLRDLTGASISRIFFITEVISAYLLLRCALATSRHSTTGIASVLLALIFSLCLLPVFLLQPYFYPGDTAGVLFILAAIYFTLKQQYLLTCGVVILGSLNRETIIAIPLLLLLQSIWPGSSARPPVKWALITLVSALSIKALIAIALRDNGGDLLAVSMDNSWRLGHNLHWLAQGNNFFYLLGLLAFTPLFAAALLPDFSRKDLPYLLTAVLLLLGLAITSNLNESRIYGDVLALLLVPMCSAIQGRNQLRP